MFYSKFVKKVISAVPGKRLGLYRFLPFFFLSGACLEYIMINWQAFGAVNFYETFKKRQAKDLAEEAILRERKYQ